MKVTAYAFGSCTFTTSLFCQVPYISMPNLLILPLLTLFTLPDLIDFYLLTYFILLNLSNSDSTFPLCHPFCPNHSIPIHSLLSLPCPTLLYLATYLNLPYLLPYNKPTQL